MTHVIDRHGNRRQLREGEILEDGERLVIGMPMMDGAPHKLHDGMGGAAGCRPGFIFTSDTSIADQRRDEAHAEMLADARTAWRAPRKRRPSRFAVKPRTIHDTADDAYEQRNAALANAWKNAE